MLKTGAAMVRFFRTYHTALLTPLLDRLVKRRWCRAALHAQHVYTRCGITSMRCVCHWTVAVVQLLGACPDGVRVAFKSFSTPCFFLGWWSKPIPKEHQLACSRAFSASAHRRQC